MLKNIRIDFSWSTLGLLTMLLLLPPGLSAQEEAQEKDQGKRRKGLVSDWLPGFDPLLRGSFGFGSVATAYDEELQVLGTGTGSEENSAMTDSISTDGFEFSLLLGTFVSENIALHGSLGYFRSADADVGDDFTISYNYSFAKGGISIYLLENFYISPEIRFPLLGKKTVAADAFSKEQYGIRGDGAGFGVRLGKDCHEEQGWGFGIYLAFARDTLKFSNDGHPIGDDVYLANDDGDIIFTNTHFSIGINVIYN